MSVKLKKHHVKLCQLRTQITLVASLRLYGGKFSGYMSDFVLHNLSANTIFTLCAL